jgi:hypothetical protein
LPYETRCKTGQTSPKVRATKSRRNFTQRTHPIHTNGPQTDVLVRFVLFRFIRDRLVALRNSVQNRPSYRKSSCCVGIFRNESTQSTSLDPNLMFWCVSYYLGAFGTVWLPYETRCKTVRSSVKVRNTKLRRNFSHERTQSTPCDPKLMFWCVRTVCAHSGPFGCLTKLGKKRAELVQKFVPRSRVGIFCNERTRSTPMDPKLTFWSVGTIWVHSGQFGSLTKLSAKRAELVQKFVPRSHV